MDAESPPVAAVKIDVDGRLTVLPDAEYVTLRSAMNGGWLETAPCRPDVCLWVDEEGKLKGLPINHRANELWSMIDEYHAQEAGDRLVGVCVVTGGSDGRGEVTPVPQWVLEHLGVVADA